jgi:translation elongation factor EF-G
MPSDGLTPSPVIEVAIEAKSKADQEKLTIALAKLAAEDPLFGVSTDHESGQTILKGPSEAHLDAKVSQLKRDGINANIGAPQVAFRERVTQRVEHSYTHKKQSGGIGQFAAVTLVVEPNEPDKGYLFESKIVGGAVPKEYISGVEKGLQSVLSSGVVAGFPVVDVKVQLIDGKYLRNRNPRLLPRGIAEGQVGTARADHEGRGGDASGLRGSSHSRFEIAKGSNNRAGYSQRCRGNPSDSAAHEHVRLRHSFA